MDQTNEDPAEESMEGQDVEQDSQDKVLDHPELEATKEESSQVADSIESQEESQESQTTSHSQETVTSASEKETDSEEAPEEDTLDLSVKKKGEAMEVDDEVPLSLSLKKEEDQEEPLSLSVKKTDHNIDEKSEIPLNLISNGIKAEMNGVITNGVHVHEELYDLDAKVVTLKELSPEEVLLRERKIRKLKARLRQEEMKLDLMKKIKQSQVVKENSSATGGPSIGQPTQDQHHHRSSKSSHGSHLSLPPSLVVDPKASAAQQHRQLLALQQQLQQQQMQAHSSSKSSSHHSMSSSASGHIPRAAHGSSSRHSSVFNPPVPPPIHGRQGIHSHHGPPVGMSSSSRSSHSAPQGMPAPAHSSHRSSGRGAPHLGNGPPNLVMGYNVHDIKAQAAQPVSRSSPPVEVIKQTREQREAAAKSQLRKQLEKTLLQIAPPKAPPPEMHFIPNANNTEFVYYIGLETVVDHITSSPNANRPPPEPFECVQCGSDFTPVWKWQEMLDPKKGNTRPAVICEACVTGNMKKALTAEHTSRLRKAFVNALQQEKDIEQRIASGTLSPPTVSSPAQDVENIQRPHRSRERNIPLDIPVVGVSRESNYRDLEREERSLLRSNHSSNNNSSNELRRHHGRGEQVRDHHHSRVREERESSRHRREQRDRELLLQQQQEQHLASLAGSLLGAGVVPQIPQPPAAHSSHSSSSRSFREDRGSRTSSGRNREEQMDSGSSSSRQQQDAAVAAAANANAMAQAMQQLATANSIMANMSKLSPVQQQAMLLQAQQLLTGLAAGPGAPGMNSAAAAAAPFMSMFSPFGMMAAPGQASSGNKNNPAANLMAGLNITPEQLQRQLLFDLIPGARNLGGSSSGDRNFRQ